MERLKDEESRTDGRPKKEINTILFGNSYNLEDIILEFYPK